MINVEKKDKSIMDKRSILGQIINLQCLCIVLVICGFILCNVAVLFAADVPLLWNAPTKNQDGTPLTDLAGYKVHYGGSSRNYSKVINAGNKLSHIVSGLNVGDTYYFAITAYDTSGNESGYSNEKKVVITNSNNAPVAAPGGKYYGTEGLEVVLDGSASSDSDGSIVLYEWDINNNGLYEYSSAAAVIRHKYTSQGNYSVRIRVTDNHGASGAAMTTVAVADTTPNASFSGSPLNGTAPLAVSFVNNSSGYDQPLTYEWDFNNDGVVDSISGNPSYTYQREGTYPIRLKVTDTDGSVNTLTRTGYVVVDLNGQYKQALSCPDGGNIECLLRTDGGSDGNNLKNEKPALEGIEFAFQINVKDESGYAPQYVRLYMTQRENPSIDEFYYYNMICSGDYITEATCGYLTQLGPAALHKFYIKAVMHDGAVLRYPDSGYITGPKITLLNGYNLIGIPREFGSDSLDVDAIFGNADVYQWDSAAGYYRDVPRSEPVRAGEGYFIFRESAVLIGLDEYGDVSYGEYSFALNNGWNIVSSPYSGNVQLSDLKVQKGNNQPITWAEAVLRGWLVDGIYTNNGSDWGSEYVIETGSEAVLVPWLGYWVYLDVGDDSYRLLIPKP